MTVRKGGEPQDTSARPGDWEAEAEHAREDDAPAADPTEDENEAGVFSGGELDPR